MEIIFYNKETTEGFILDGKIYCVKNIDFQNQIWYNVYKIES